MLDATLGWSHAGRFGRVSVGSELISTWSEQRLQPELVVGFDAPESWPIIPKVSVHGGLWLQDGKRVPYTCEAVGFWWGRQLGAGQVSADTWTAFITNPSGSSFLEASTTLGWQVAVADGGFVQPWTRFAYSGVEDAFIPQAGLTVGGWR